MLLASMEDYACDSTQLANYLRCLSGAFHNLGGALYQASQHSHAARFLEQSCIAGSEALAKYRIAALTSNTESPVAAETGKQNPWTQLEEQMYRRWEILGVCHSKTGDRKMAFDSFVHCVQAFPFSKPSFLELASQHSVSAIFESNPALKHVAEIIDRLTFTGVCDLLLQPQAISLRPYFADYFIPNDVSTNASAARRIITGALLEFQAQSLDGCKWKEDGRKAINYFLDEAFQVYGEDMPIRRARVILKLLELVHCGYDAALGANSTYTDLGKEVESLLTRRDLGMDHGLAHFRIPFRAILRLRLALLVHREAQTSQFSKVVTYAEEACSILKSALSAAPPRRKSTTPAHSPKVARTLPGRRVVSKGQTAAPSKLSTTRTRTRTIMTVAVAPATPEKKRRMSSSLAIHLEILISMRSASSVKHCSLKSFGF
jgi:separase